VTFGYYGQSGGGQSSTSDARNDKWTCVSAWILGWFMCKAVAYIQGVSVAASVYSLVAVSLDRYVPLVRFYSRAKRPPTHTGARPCRCWRVAYAQARLTVLPSCVFSLRYCANSNAIYDNLLLAEHWLHWKWNEARLKFNRWIVACTRARDYADIRTNEVFYYAMVKMIRGEPVMRTG